MPNEKFNLLIKQDHQIPLTKLGITTNPITPSTTSSSDNDYKLIQQIWNNFTNLSDQNRNLLLKGLLNRSNNNQLLSIITDLNLFISTNNLQVCILLFFIYHIICTIMYMYMYMYVTFYLFIFFLSFYYSQNLFIHLIFIQNI